MSYRAAATVGMWNAVSRASGLVRVLAVAGALGATFLGNTYQSANLVSNVLFELVAAGLLSAPLVPILVAMLAEDRRGDADALLGELLGLAAVLLGVLAFVGAVGGRLVMGLLVSGAPGSVRSAQVALGAFLLWFFLPQLVLYGVGAIATAALQAERRFAVASAAPVANNLAVTITMVVFAAVVGTGSGLTLPLGPRILLGAGTTAGVALMSLLPVIAARRAGFSLRPRWNPRSPAIRDLGRRGRWAAAYLASNQVLIAATLILANRVEGGVVAYQTAFTFFLLPFALLAHPVITTAFPALAAMSHGGDARGFATETARSVRTLLLLLVPATVALAALAGPVVRLIRVGALDSAGAQLVAKVTAAYALGLAGYGLLHFGSRAFAAMDDFRTPALVGAGVAAAATALMIAGVALTRGDAEVIALGVATSIAMLGGAATLLWALRRRLVVDLGGLQA